MKKILIVLLFACISLHAEIRIAEELRPIEKALESCDKKTLVLLDLGETIMGAKDPALHSGHDKWKNEWYKREFPNLTREERVRLAFDLRSDKSIWKLHDPNWPSIITAAREKGAKVIALTKMTVDPSLEGLTKEVTSYLGLSFDQIIETDAPLKGPILEKHLETLSVFPGKIIFVDDRMDQIESVHAVCVKAHIPCVAFHLTAFSTPPPLNEKIADTQFRLLATEHRWVPLDQLADLCEK